MAFIFDWWMVVFEKSFLRTKMSHPNLGFMPNGPTCWATEPDISFSMYRNAGFGNTDISVAYKKKWLTPVGHELLIFEFMPNDLTIWATRTRHFLYNVFENWLTQYRCYVCDINIWIHIYMGILLYKFSKNTFPGQTVFIGFFSVRLLLYVNRIQDKYV